MKIDVKVKDELKELVEGTGYETYEEEVAARENLKVLCKECEKVTGIKSTIISKLIKVYYKSSLEEDKATFEEFDDLYREVLG